MSRDELLARLGLALAIGFLIGLERGWRERGLAEGTRTAGLRTFALIGFSGGVWGTLSNVLGPVPLAAGFLAVAAAITVFRWREATREGEYGATTLIAALLTFALGAYAVLGDMTVAAAAAVATAGLLAAKSVLHRWVAAMTWPELRATLVLLAMSFVALPLLPDDDFGPYGAFNPHALWLMTIAIAGVSYIGYAAVKLIGDRYGAIVAGIGGGIVSSTAVTLDAARKASREPARVRIELVAALIASAIMFGRVLVVVTLFGAPLVPWLAAPLVAAAAVTLAVAGVLFRVSSAAGDGGTPAAVKNPFELISVLRFAVLLTVITFLSKWLTAVFGQSGAVAVAATAGLADVDAITLSMAGLAGQGLSPFEAGRAILVAVAANSVAKSAVALSVGGVRFGAGYVAATAAALAAGAATLFAVSLAG